MEKENRAGLSGLLGIYMPEDRLWALAESRDLPERTWGAALFADISGFTPLAENLVKEFGTRRGAEELTQQINAVFEAIISALHRYQGCVIGFSGDAITCWLDQDNGQRATACALEMQSRIQALGCVVLPSGTEIALGLKAAVACGPIRRFVVGDPEIQLIDVMAGRTLEHLAAAEHLAGRGEVLLHPTAYAAIREQLQIAGWRADSQTPERFAVVRGLVKPVKPQPWPCFEMEKVPEEQIRPWLLPPVFRRLEAGLGRFLAELRPAAALFVQFSGIDYDDDNTAREKLDDFIRGVERIVDGYEGSLIQLTIGDKGSYLYAAFGAPIAHEDDGARAVAAAGDILDLQRSYGYITSMRLGISRGRMRTGDYGGQLRRTYGVLGDEVNVAARLMQAAEPGQILGSREIAQSTLSSFHWVGPRELTLKGKPAPLEVFSLERTTNVPDFRAQAPHHTLPMVGREPECEQVECLLQAVAEGHGRILTITGEAGVGKSRLVAEVVRLSLGRRFKVFSGACQPFGTRINYLVWQDIFRALFDLDPTWTASRQVEALGQKFAEINPLLPLRLPLLGSVLGLAIPENDLTRSLDPKLRKASLEALLVDCLKSQAEAGPYLLVLEDCHWMDDLSRDLLVEVGRTITSSPSMVVLAYRPGGIEWIEKLGVRERGVFHEIDLARLPRISVEEIIRLNVDRLFGGYVSAQPALVEAITARAEGNPFYVEELLNYLRDRGVDPQNPGQLEGLALPDTLQCLILSRIDQLEETLKITLKIASVIGREFRAGWLWGYSAELGDSEIVRVNLQALSRVELLSLQESVPELIYLFKHILTQEVAYESLPFATRAALHGQLGNFIEIRFSEAQGSYLDLLAYHYDLSDNASKRCEYLVKAGEASQVGYANEAAIDYFERALPLLSGSERVRVMRKLGEVLEHVGRWAQAGVIYQQGIVLAAERGDPQAQAQYKTAMGELQRKQGAYVQALDWLDSAEAIYQSLGDEIGIGQVLHYRGTVSAHMGEYESARDFYSRSLAIRRRLDDRPQIASLLSNLGIIARFQGQYGQARLLHEEALVIRRALGDKWAIGVSLNNLGNVAIDQGDLAEAGALQEEGLAIRRAVGDRWAIANALNNLGNLARAQGVYDKAASLYLESLVIIKDLEDPWALSYLFEDLGCLAVLQNLPERAWRLVGAASRLRESIGAPLSPAEQDKLAGALDAGQAAIHEDQRARAYQAGRKMSLDEATRFAGQLDVAL